MKSQNLDSELYQYVLEHSSLAHPILADLAEETQKRPDARMQISPDQGSFMKLISEVTAPKLALEIGCYTGYSAIATASGLPTGSKLYSLDINEDTTAVAKRFIDKAGLGQKVEIYLGQAKDSLKRLLAEFGPESFGLAFIDADKQAYIDYFEACFELLKPGGLILVDNVLWSGRVVKPAQDEDTKALQEFNAYVSKREGISGCMLHLGDGVRVLRKNL